MKNQKKKKSDKATIRESLYQQTQETRRFGSGHGRNRILRYKRKPDVDTYDVSQAQKLARNSQSSIARPRYDFTANQVVIDTIIGNKHESNAIDKSCGYIKNKGIVGGDGPEPEK